MREVQWIAAVAFLFSITIGCGYLFLGGETHFVYGGWSLLPVMLTVILIAFAGAFITLLYSSEYAKEKVNLTLINPNDQSHQYYWVYCELVDLANQAGINTPSIGYYLGERNAFSVGLSKNNSLICISEELISHMSQDSLRIILQHQVGQIANGDMVLMLLIKGVFYALSIGGASIIAIAIGLLIRIIIGIIFSDNDMAEIWARNLSTFASSILSSIFNILFGFFAIPLMIYFSRKRIYQADAFAAQHNTVSLVTQALMEMESPIQQDYKIQKFLGNYFSQSLGVYGIRRPDRNLLSAIICTHPTLNQRIHALSITKQQHRASRKKLLQKK